MNLMELYGTMSDTDLIPVLDYKAAALMSQSSGTIMFDITEEAMIHSLNESFAVISWRTTPDSKVAASFDFGQPLLIYTEDKLRAGMTAVHRHDYIEIAYVVKGEFSQFISGKLHTFTQGSLCIIDRNSEHADYVKDEDNFVLFLCLKQDFFDELFFSELDDSNLQQFIRRALMKQKSLKQFLLFTPRNQEDVLYPLVEQVAKEKFENRKGSRHVIKGLIIRLFDILTRDYDINLTSTQLKKMNDLLFAEVEEYIRNNYRDASLKELTKRFHFQQDYFARLIKKHTGNTFSEQLRKIRMAKAEELLLNTHMSVRSIIEAVGYENKHHFYNIFYESYSMTPEQYRQKQGSNDQ